MSLRLRRRRLALAACVAWLVAFEFAPWLHVALHDHLGHHHHDASGAIIQDGDDDHDHGDDADDDAATPTHLEGVLAHGRHNLAHHGIAVVPPPPAVTHPLPVDRRVTFAAIPAARAPRALDPLAAVARGPPHSLLG